MSQLGAREPCIWVARCAIFTPLNGRSTAAACRSALSCWSPNSTLPIRREAGGNLHPIDAYAHVPAGYGGNHPEQRDASALCASIERVIEQYAPGFRERIVAKEIRTPADVERDNANFVGGNITTGANTLGGLVGRPRLSTDPYAVTGRGDGPQVYLCSAATPPGAGAHGLCGLYAAQAALSR